MEEKDYCIDVPDERDFDYEVLWEMKELPKKIKLIAKVIQNQKLDWWIYWCVYYGWSSWSNITNDYAKNTQEISWRDLCKKAVDLGYLDPESWSILINWWKLLKSEKYIEWYFKVSWIENMKQALSNNRILHTWSNKIAWKKMWADNIAVRGTSYGHCFIIIGYDDDSWVFIVQNSYWSDFEDKGYFYIKYEDIDILFTCYTFEVDQKNILLYKQKIMENIKLEWAKKAFENWFWNGLNWDKPLTREEGASMVERLYEKLSNQN